MCRALPTPSPPPPVSSVDHVLYEVGQESATILWLSLPAHILLPQRTTQYAYPVVLLCLLLLLRAHQAMPRSGPVVEGAEGGPGSRPSSRRGSGEDGAHGAAAPGVAGLAAAGGGGVVAASSPLCLDVTWATPSAKDRVALYAVAGVLAGLLPLLQVRAISECLHAACVGPFAALPAALPLAPALPFLLLGGCWLLLAGLWLLLPSAAGLLHIASYWCC